MDMRAIVNILYMDKRCAYNVIYNGDSNSWYLGNHERCCINIAVWNIVKDMIEEFVNE